MTDDPVTEEMRRAGVGFPEAVQRLVARHRYPNLGASLAEFRDILTELENAVFWDDWPAIERATERAVACWGKIKPHTHQRRSPFQK